MRINKQSLIFFELAPVILGFFLSLSFLYLSQGYWVSDIEWQIRLFISLLIAIFASSSTGLILENRSRSGGALLLLTTAPFLFVFYKNGFLMKEGFALGITLGLLFSMRSYTSNNYEKLVRSLKKLFIVSLVANVGYLFYVFFQRTVAIDSIKSVQDVQQYISTISGSAEFSDLLLILGLLIVIYLILYYFIHGIRAYDVFIYGPASSGKTFLLLAFYKQFVNDLKGITGELILGASNAEDFKIGRMLSKLESGINPKSNERVNLAVYNFTGKKNLKPVELTFVDYSGEHTFNLDSPSKYDETLSDLSSEFKVEKQVLDKNLGNFSFLENLRNNSYVSFVNKMSDVVFAYVKNKFKTAGKVIFLVDGELIVDYNEIRETGKTGKQELTELFDDYSKIMASHSKTISKSGDDKSYAIVVTKIDMIKDLSDSDGSKAALNIEKEIYDRLLEIDTFKEIRNRARETPVYFYTISVDKTKRPVKPEEYEEQDIIRINPWGVDRLADFIF